MKATVTKKKTTLIASSLLICLLCAVTAVTYARYVTKATASDTARIAKWGVEMSAVGTLYGEQYDENGKTQVWSDSDKGTVHVSASGNGVVAPGTGNTGGLAISLTGQPEVKTNVKVELKSENIYLKAGTYAIAHQVASGVVTEANYGTLKEALYQLSENTYTAAPAEYDEAITQYYIMRDNVKLTDDYYPVVYKSSNYKSSDISSDSLKYVADNIAGKLGTAEVTEKDGVTTYTVSTQYDPGTDLGTKLNMSEETISWDWAYIQDTEEGTDKELMYSGADTILGSLEAADSAVVKASGDNFVAVAENKDYHLDTSLDLTMTVTQVN